MEGSRGGVVVAGEVCPIECSMGVMVVGEVRPVIGVAVGVGVVGSGALGRASVVVVVGGPVFLGADAVPGPHTHTHTTTPQHTTTHIHKKTQKNKSRTTKNAKEYTHKP